MMMTYGQPLIEPILGKHFRLPYRGRRPQKPVLDKSLPYIPVYRYLLCHHLTPIKRPTTPRILQDLRSRISTNADNEF